MGPLGCPAKVKEGLGVYCWDETEIAMQGSRRKPSTSRDSLVDDQNLTAFHFKTGAFFSLSYPPIAWAPNTYVFNPSHNPFLPSTPQIIVSSVPASTPRLVPERRGAGETLLLWIEAPTLASLPCLTAAQTTFPEMGSRVFQYRGTWRDAYTSHARHLRCCVMLPKGIHYSLFSSK